MEEVDKVPQYAAPAPEKALYNQEKTLGDAVNENYGEPEDVVDPEEDFQSVTGDETLAAPALNKPQGNGPESPLYNHHVSYKMALLGEDIGGTGSDGVEDFEGSVERFDSVSEQLAPVVESAIAEKSAAVSIYDVEESSAIGNDADGEAVARKDIYVAPAYSNDVDLSATNAVEQDTVSTSAKELEIETSSGSVESNGPAANGQLESFGAGGEVLEAPIEEENAEKEKEKNDAVSGSYEDMETKDVVSEIQSTEQHDEVSQQTNVDQKESKQDTTETVQESGPESTGTVELASETPETAEVGEVGERAEVTSDVHGQDSSVVGTLEATPADVSSGTDEVAIVMSRDAEEVYDEPELSQVVGENEEPKEDLDERADEGLTKDSEPVPTSPKEVKLLPVEALDEEQEDVKGKQVQAEPLEELAVETETPEQMTVQTDYSESSQTEKANVIHSLKDIFAPVSEVTEKPSETEPNEAEGKPVEESVEENTSTADESSASEREEGTQNARIQDSEGSANNTKPLGSDLPSLGGAGPSLPARPAGLGRSIPSLEPAPRAIQRTSAAPTRQTPATNEENGSSTDVSEGNEDAREKLQTIRIKFLRLAHRLGQSPHNVVVAQVLYRLGLAEQIRGGRGSGRTGTFSFETASMMAEQLELAGRDDLDFACTIMVLGKSGVGKSATINSLFDEVKSGTNAFSPSTTKVQEITGTVHGIKLRVIDTPGLLTSSADQRRNEKIMASVKRFIKKTPPDIVLYFDRLDMQSRDYGDLPLLRTITDTFGSAVWFNAIVVLTHASSAPPDGANGVPVSYEMFVAQRSHVVQQTIRQAAGDMRLMNPVSLVENHPACRRNRAGERVLPNGQVWKPQLLLLCFASKILAEANSLLKLQDNTPAKPFGVRSRVPPLPFLLSSLLQSRAQLKHPEDQMGTDDDSDIDSSSDEDSDGEEEYDDLPPFRRLTKAELKLLDKEQRKIYSEEIEYREKLFMKKQLKEERARKREMKRRLASLPKEVSQYVEDSMEEENASAQVPVPMPDMALPPSFDSDNPTHRYRYLDTNNQWLVRPVLETHGWDHDSGYDGLNVEKMFLIGKKIPASVSGQVTKDKKEANLQMECAASFKNGKGKVTQAALDVQTIGKDLSYTLRSETRFINFKKNKTTLGFAVTLLGDTVAPGVKMENHLLVGKRLKLVVNGGALRGRGDVAYGGSLEATLRDKDYPIGQFLSTLGLSVMNWHGDLAVGGNLQVQFKVGKTTMVARGNLNNRRAGQISIRASSSEQLQMALIGIIPLLRTFINNRILSSN